MNGSHLTDIALIVLATGRKTHPHLESCTYCREQYDALLEMEELRYSEKDIPGNIAAEPSQTNGFRLAAQSDVGTDSDLVLRQTWYLDEGRVLLRVFEEEANVLVGYVLCAPERLPSLRFRFSGIDNVFIPSKNGSFVIGDPDIPIEPMAVTFEELM